MSEAYEPGELFVYRNGDRWELGMVKGPNHDGSGYFCWYSRGDTAANTPTRCMHRLANAGLTRVERELDELKSENGELRALAHDALAVILGWSAVIGEHVGAGSVAAGTHAELARRARGLGVPDA